MPAIHLETEGRGLEIPGSGYAQCNGRTTLRYHLTSNASDVTCKRCLAKLEARKRCCDGCGERFDFASLTLCQDDGIRCPECSLRFQAREPM